MNRTVRWCVLFAALTLPLLAQAAPVRIGSKVFTESVILGELAKATAGQFGGITCHYVTRQVRQHGKLFSALTDFVVVPAEMPWQQGEIAQHGQMREKAAFLDHVANASA